MQLAFYEISILSSFVISSFLCYSFFPFLLLHAVLLYSYSICLVLTISIFSLHVFCLASGTVDEPPVVVIENRHPCVPSPCGPNSVCRTSARTPICSCSTGYIGRPPNCRPECTINAECAGNLACVNERCVDPCPGSCGYHAQCAVVSHSPVCTCESGYSGDPFIGCAPYVEGK